MTEIDLFPTQQIRKCYQLCSRGGHSSRSLSDTFLVSKRGKISMYLSPHSCGAKSFVQTQTGSCHATFDSTSLVSLALTLGPIKPFDLRSGLRHSYSGPWPDTASQSSQPVPGCLVVIWVTLQEAACSLGVQNVLLNCRKLSVRYILP